MSALNTRSFGVSAISISSSLSAESSFAPRSIFSRTSASSFASAAGETSNSALSSAFAAALVAMSGSSLAERAHFLAQLVDHAVRLVDLGARRDVVELAHELDRAILRRAQAARRAHRAGARLEARSRLQHLVRDRVEHAAPGAEERLHVGEGLPARVHRLQLLGEADLGPLPDVPDDLPDRRLRLARRGIRGTDLGHGFGEPGVEPPPDRVVRAGEDVP